jgi:hypothetical protein
MGGRDPPGQQRLAGGGEPFDLVELGPQLAGRAAADRVWVDRGDQLFELPADPNQSMAHVYDSRGACRHSAERKIRECGQRKDRRLSCGKTAV